MSENIYEYYQIRVLSSDGIWLTLKDEYDTDEEAVEAMVDKRSRNKTKMQVVKVSAEIIAELG